MNRRLLSSAGEPWLRSPDGVEVWVIVGVEMEHLLPQNSGIVRLSHSFQAHPIDSALLDKPEAKHRRLSSSEEKKICDSKNVLSRLSGGRPCVLLQFESPK